MNRPFFVVKHQEITTYFCNCSIVTRVSRFVNEFHILKATFKFCTRLSTFVMTFPFFPCFYDIITLWQSIFLHKNRTSVLAYKFCKPKFTSFAVLISAGGLCFILSSGYFLRSLAVRLMSLAATSWHPSLSARSSP